MRTLLTALTAFMLFATPVVAGDWEDAWDAYGAGDYRKSMRLLKSLIEEGSKWAPAARLKVRTMYWLKKGAPKDPFKRFHWYRKGAKQGYDSAQYELGTMYRKGQGVAKDYAKAIYWFKKSVEQDGRGPTDLGEMYANGEGVPKDDVKAAEWYRQSAERGGVLAQFRLGEMYGNGEGVPENYAQAYAWISIAAAQGYEPAKEGKSIIKKQMTPALIAEAQNLSSELWEKYVVPFQK